MDKKEIKRTFAYGLLLGLVLYIFLINPTISREKEASFSRGEQVIEISGTQFFLSDIQFLQFQIIGLFALGFGFLGLLILSFFENKRVRLK